LSRQIGTEKVLWGTNYPGGGLGEYLDALNALPFRSSENEAVAGGNVASVFRK
jgi:hypothetical protein